MWEMHKYEYLYDRALDHRINILALLNFTAPCVYIAFGWVKMHVASPIAMLSLQVRWALVTNLFLIIAREALTFAERRFTLQLRQGRRLEDELRKEEFSGQVFSSQYREILLPLLFFFLVGVADPFCSSLLLVLTLVINLRLDMHQVMHFLRKPLPVRCESIGVERLALIHKVARVGLWSNWTVMCMFGSHIGVRQYLSLGGRMRSLGIYWFGITVLQLLSWVFVTWIPEVSSRTATLQKRHDWQRARVARLDDELAAQQFSL